MAEGQQVPEIDAEQYAALKANPKLELVKPTPAMMVDLHLNHLVAPFNNPKIARAAIMAINQEALMRAQMVNKDLYRACTSLYLCDSPLASSETAYFTGKPQFAAAKALLKEAGYDGKPVVLLYPADFAVLNKFPPVMAQLLKQAGFNVDMQAMDWTTMMMRRTSKAPSDKGGWNLFHTWTSAPDMLSPALNIPLRGNGAKAWFGWPTDAKLEELIDAWFKASDPAMQKKLADEIQTEAYKEVPYVPTGQFVVPTAYRKNLDGIIIAPVVFLWNVEKK